MKPYHKQVSSKGHSWSSDDQYDKFKAETAKANEAKKKRSSKIPAVNTPPLYDKNEIINSTLAQLWNLLCPSPTSFLAQLQFFFSHPPREDLAFSLDQLKAVLEGIEENRFENIAREKLQKELDINASELQYLKDVTKLSNEAVKVWIEKLPGLTCSFRDLDLAYKANKEEMKKILCPVETPDECTIDLQRLIFLMEAAYPLVLGKKALYGVNMNGTQMGNRNTTSASIKFLNDELEFKGISLNSSKNEWFFCLYYGSDDRFYLIDNVFRNDQPGKPILSVSSPHSD